MEYKKIITIDSLFRENIAVTKSSDFRVHLRDNLINVISMKLHDIIIPYSWYRISAEQGNNSIFIASSGVCCEYSLPDGNYNSIEHICNHLFSGVGPTCSGNYCLRQDSLTKKVTIRSGCVCGGSGNGDILQVGSGDGPTLQVRLTCDGTDPTRTLGWLLGFREDITALCPHHTGGGVLLIGSDIRCRYFYLVIDDYKSIDNFNAESMNRVKFINGFILARLIIQIQDNTLSHVRFEQYTRIYDAPCDINKLDIKLIDEWGYIVNLNGMEMSLSLELTIKL